MSRNAPNARLVSAADKLARYTAAQVTAAVEVLRDRIAHAHTDSGEGERVHTSDLSNPTERAGLARYMLTLELENLRDSITDACAVLDQLAETAVGIQRACAPNVKPEELKLCKHGQQGREGAVEWGDPLCDRLPVKLGMCEREYMRYRRHCEQHGIDRRKDYEPAA